MNYERTQIKTIIQGNRHTYKEVPGDLFELTSKYVMQGATGIYLEDLDAIYDTGIDNRETFRELSGTYAIDIIIRGGVRNEADFENYLGAGFNKVVVSTAVVKDPQLVQNITRNYNDLLSVGIDYYHNKVITLSGDACEGKIDLIEYIQMINSWGVNQIILSDVEREGMLQGPNLKQIVQLCSIVPDASIYYSNGISSIDDLRDLANLKLPNLRGIIIGTALHFGRFNLHEANDAINSNSNSPSIEMVT